MNNEKVIDLSEPNKIYDLILDSIEDIEQKLKGKTGDEKLDNAQQQVLKIIRDVRTIEIDKSIEELKENQEWDTFTIAFYGETNAGKSTIIESLRIYFQEEEKIKAQTEFTEIEAEYKSEIERSEKKLLELRVKIDEYQIKHTDITSDFESKKEDLEAQTFDMRKVDAKKRSDFFWHKVLSFLNLNSLEKEIGRLETEQKKEEQRIQNTLKILHTKNELDEEKLKDLEKQIDQLHKSTIQKLDNLSDGRIIGDGRSDFTQKTDKYFFKNNKQKFSFLDIPGIEGNESGVIDEIGSALKNAHAVFYVTSNAMPPQKGTDKKKGTLEKIKEHLGNQTEVYTIFNKRITNPMQLNKPLISDEEKLSLDVLNQKMREIIGENYINNKFLTAKVSFLALSKCLVPGSKIIAEKNKFLNKFTTEDLLEKAAFNSFIGFITNDLIENSQLKIKKSNLAKVNNVLKKLINALTLSSENNFKPLYKELSQDVQDVSNNLDNILRATKNRMKAEVKKVTKKFATETRSKIFSYIDGNVNNQEFKNKLESEIKTRSEKLIIELPLSLEKELEKFQVEIVEVLENFKRRANLAIMEFNTIDFDTENSDFKIEMNLDNGIDGLGIGGSVLGAGVLAYTAITLGNSWNPLGWAMFAVGVVTVLIGFGKSIRKFFSDDYKKAQQRDSASENIDKITQQIVESVNSKIDESFVDFGRETDAIVDKLQEGVGQIKKANDCLISSSNELIKLSKIIQKEGGK